MEKGCGTVRRERLSGNPSLHLRNTGDTKAGAMRAAAVDMQKGAGYAPFFS